MLSVREASSSVVSCRPFMTPFLPNPHAHRRRPEPHQGPRKALWGGPSLTPAKEATRRRAQGATLPELADSYDRSISAMRRATRAARAAFHSDRHLRLFFESLDAELETFDAGSDHRGDTGNDTHHRHNRADTGEQHHAADDNRRNTGEGLQRHTIPLHRRSIAGTA